MKTRSLSRVESVLHVLFLWLTIALRRTIINMPRFIVACSLMLPLLLIRDWKVVLNHRTCGYGSVEFGNIFRWLKSRLLFQITFYRNLILAISPVVALRIIRSNRTIILVQLRLVNFSRLVIRHHNWWVACGRLLLLTLTASCRGRVHRFRDLTVALRGNTRNFVTTLSDYERTGILLWRCTSIVGRLISFNRISLFFGWAGAWALGQFRLQNTVCLTHPIFGISKSLSIKANFLNQFCVFHGLTAVLQLRWQPTFIFHIKLRMSLILQIQIVNNIFLLLTGTRLCSLIK